MVLRLLTSIRLAVGLLVLLILFSAAATLVPQDRPLEFYTQVIPGALLPVFLALEGNHFFSSPLFLTLVGLFTLNLGACTLKRLVSQGLRKGKNWGPDVIHIGLLVLTAGALWSGFGRSEVNITLGAGETLPLPEGSILEIVSLKFERHQDGRPKEWLTQGRLKTPRDPRGQEVQIRVNEPLQAGGLSFYQYSYGPRMSVLLQRHSVQALLYEEETQEMEGMTVRFRGPVARAENQRRIIGAGLEIDGRLLALGPGETYGGWQVVEVKERDFTTLKAAHDPGYPLVLVSFLITALGMGMVLWKRFKEA